MIGLVLAPQDDELTLNAGHGEGGGQIIRTALALATATGRTVRLMNIRGNRRPTGLRYQQRVAALALRELCGGEITAAEVDSRWLRFSPGGRVFTSDYRFPIGVAGATSLVLQAIFPALVTALPATGGRLTPRMDSRVVLVGGTHVPMSPTAGYLTEVWVEAARRLGFGLSVSLVQPGFVPRGDGVIHATVTAHRPATCIDWSTGAEEPRVTARAGVAWLPISIGQRMLEQTRRRLASAGIDFDPARDGEIIDHGKTSASPGAYLELFLTGGQAPAGACYVGLPGLPSEVVADRAVYPLILHQRSGAAVDPYLADQLVLLLALCQPPEGGESRYRTSMVTLHLLTQADVVSTLWPVSVRVQGAIGQPGEVIVIHK